MSKYKKQIILFLLIIELFSVYLTSSFNKKDIKEENKVDKEMLNKFRWWSDYNTDTPWPNSLIYSFINGSSFLKNTTYVPSGWEEKIATMDWKYGKTTKNGSYDGATIYALEDAWTTTVSAKIGLMYIYDYYYAYASGGAPGNYNNAATSWIRLQHNEDTLGISTLGEWFMTYKGAYTGRYFAYFLASMGSVDVSTSSSFLNASNPVRLVFYLTSNIKIIGGTGTIDNPYIIN